MELRRGRPPLRSLPLPGESLPAARLPLGAPIRRLPNLRSIVDAPVHSGSVQVQRRFVAVQSGGAAMRRHFVAVQSGAAAAQRRFVVVQSGSAAEHRRFVAVQSGSAAVQRHFAAAQHGSAAVQRHFAAMQSGSAAAQRPLAVVQSGVAPMHRAAVPADISRSINPLAPTRALRGRLDKGGCDETQNLFGTGGSLAERRPEH